MCVILRRLKAGEIYVECGANGNDDDMEPASFIARQQKAVKGYFMLYVRCLIQ